VERADTPDPLDVVEAIWEHSMKAKYPDSILPYATKSIDEVDSAAIERILLFI
jgi:hypothetical protein